MVRLNLIKGLGPALQIAEGWTIRLPEEVSDILWKRTDYTWPCTWLVQGTKAGRELGTHNVFWDIGGAVHVED